ncbi:MAG: Si-specific NAD(P)(+) transhydrogenase [Deltaproteobacteria bacterium]|jgi:NAD(P) transhydrogenase|nr:Si-specific NAD(P)(+) transhydrogenase [Deltaproteobacteria bacterium]MBT4088862.1 Si-specific NAD(P)(+) transhydrogenase [Deltaproteobacteria bacterium]MBT4267777.1 Si-specific NAD(P)(+) transhydrogenase [Deltaproteobacteria bacterium]MBT4644575.1 Si-specific NAD(P)(+) transhydrogenase [Deltaproteobacteria bacterium]MBT6499848.1 Si-specific NAD(P)(+) transhydrogenase [Deltaproteobacteria bacterium]
MEEQIYDIAVIGAGPAGEKAALEAASAGAKVIIIEKSTQPGGASVITGTIPSKSLRETVKYMMTLAQQDISGINLSLKRPISVKELMHRKDVVVSQRVEDILDTYNRKNVDFIFGAASFLSPGELLVKQSDKKDQVVRAKKTIIAVGTVPYHPPDIEFDGNCILDSDSILSLDKIPDSMAVYGGGVIGCEYASIFALLGVKVHLIDTRGTLLSFLDREISIILADILKQCGINLLLGETYETIKSNRSTVQTVLKSGTRVETSTLLYANGRQGTAEQLNLKNCGLELNSRNQLNVNHNYQTENPNIYAIGDVIGFPSLVSVSNEEGRLAARHAVLKTDVKRVTGDIPYGIYTIPEIGLIGATEQELIENRTPYEKGICLFKDLARGLIIGDRRGLLKLLFHRDTHCVLGVHICGKSATELIHIGQAVMNLGGTIEYFLENVFNFPTLSAAYKVAASDGLRRMKM